MWSGIICTCVAPYSHALRHGVSWRGAFRLHISFSPVFVLLSSSVISFATAKVMHSYVFGKNFEEMLTL